MLMIDTRNREMFAMKVLNRKHVQKMRQEQRLETEKALLRQIRSPFICRLYAETEDESSFYLLLELIHGGELKRLIHPQGASLSCLCSFRRPSAHLFFLVRILEKATAVRRLPERIMCRYSSPAGNVLCSSY